MPALFRKAALENLDSSEHLDHMMQVTTPSRWLLAAGFCLIFGALAVWGFRGNIRTFADATGFLTGIQNKAPAHGARLFLPAHEGGKLHKGLRVWLEPEGYPAANFGYLVGEITSMQTLAAADRARQPELAPFTHPFPPEEDLLEVRVFLKRAEDPKAGVWTLARSDAFLPAPGTPIKAKIILAEQRPVDLFLKSRFEAK